MPKGELVCPWAGSRQIEHGLNLGDGEDDGEFLFLFGNLNIEEGIVIPGATMVQPFVEAAKGGEVKANGGATFLLLHELKKVATEVVGGEGLPRAGGFGELAGKGDESVAIVFDGAR